MGPVGFPAQGLPVSVALTAKPGHALCILRFPFLCNWQEIAAGLFFWFFVFQFTWEFYVTVTIQKNLRPVGHPFSHG